MKTLQERRVDLSRLCRSLGRLAAHKLLGNVLATYRISSNVLHFLSTFQFSINSEKSEQISLLLPYFMMFYWTIWTIYEFPVKKNVIPPLLRQIMSARCMQLGCQISGVFLKKVKMTDKDSHSTLSSVSVKNFYKINIKIDA